jgi:hypothetical protein
MPREFIEALPRRLERFYVSDKFIPIYHLVKWVSEFHLPGTTFDEDIGAFASASQIKSVSQTSKELARKEYIPIHSGKLGFVAFEYHSLHQGRVRMIEASDRETMEITQATREAAEVCKNDCDGKAATQEHLVMGLLRLNGILLDRERQQHLTHLLSRPNPHPSFNPGQHIPPRIESSLVATSGEMLLDLISACALTSNINDFERPKQEALDVDADWSFMGAPNMESTANDTFFASDESNHTYESVLPSNSICEPEYHFTNKSYDAYFGNEADAERVFAVERVMKAEDIPPRKYPVIVACPTAYQEHEHWMCC